MKPFWRGDLKKSKFVLIEWTMDLFTGSAYLLREFSYCCPFNWEQHWNWELVELKVSNFEKRGYWLLNDAKVAIGEKTY